MGKTRKSSAFSSTIAGFTPEQWKQHMDTDEEWTDRLTGVADAQVLEIVAALEHGDAAVRGLACNLAYALGVEGLGARAPEAVERLATLAQSDPVAKVKKHAGIVHEGLAGALERATMRREMPWLAGYDPDVVPAAISAIDDARASVRLQVYLWWANAPTIPDDARAAAEDRLVARIAQENDPMTRRAAELALGHVRARPH